MCKFENEDIIIKEVVKRLNSLPDREREDGLIKLTTLLGLRKKLEKRLLKEVDDMPIKVLDHPLYKKGIEKTKREDVIKLFTNLNLSPDKISKGLNISIGKVIKILKEEGLL